MQLTARHVEEFAVWKYPGEQQKSWVGIDERAVTNEGQLGAVPDYVFRPRKERAP
jgi:hypothetical protein